MHRRAMNVLIVVVCILSLALTSFASVSVGVPIAPLPLDDSEVHGCSYEGMVKCYIHESPAASDGENSLSDFVSAVSLGRNVNAEEAASVLDFLQGEATRKRLRDLDIYVRFLDEQNVSAYAAQELQKIMPEVMPLCVAYEAALRWTVEDCATDVVLQLQAFIISQTCRSREYAPHPLDVDSSAATCGGRLALEAGLENKFKQTGHTMFASMDSGAADALKDVVAKSSYILHHTKNVLGIAAAAQASLRQQIWEELIEPRLFGTFWNSYYDSVVAFVAKYHGGISSDGQKVRIVEIGTCYGGLADRLAGELRGAHIYAVDPFEVDYDSEDSTSSQRNRWFKSWLNTTDDSSSSERVSSGGRSGQKDESNNSEAAEAAFFSTAWADALAEKLHERHGCRAHVVPLRSTDAALLFEDHSVDSVFIDGLHTYQGVAADVLAWLPKLKLNGGSLIFNDYGSDLFPGVTRAVSDMIRGIQNAARCRERSTGALRKEFEDAVSNAISDAVLN